MTEVSDSASGRIATQIANLLRNGRVLSEISERTLSLLLEFAWEYTVRVSTVISLSILGLIQGEILSE